jgi:hypothetical protein
LCRPHEQLAAATDSTLPPNANRQNLVSTGCASPTFKMRTYDDSFSGQKIYPGKVRFVPSGIINHPAISTPILYERNTDS